MRRHARRLTLLLAVLAVALAAVWLRPTVERELPPIAGTVDRIMIQKAARRMTLWQRDRVVRTYVVALGFSPTGDKARQGDGRTPEGVFRIDRRNDASRYHLSLGLDYPHERHRLAATGAGFDPGGDIMIHGQPNALPEGMKLAGDWTAGCIALSDAEMDEVWAVTDSGTVVEIRP
jgi:murein L,D-transpeptidase YafK